MTQTLDFSQDSHDDSSIDAVAAYGDAVICGILPGKNNLGKAVIFRKTQSGWKKEADLVPQALSPKNMYGLAVALGDKVAIVADPLERINGKIQSALYTFSYDGVTWTEQERIVLTSGRWWGQSLALDGDLLAVGNFVTDKNQDVVLLFRYNNGQWLPEDTLFPNSEDGDYFGWDIDVSGNTVIVGSPGNSHFGEDVGAAHVFEKKDGGWSLVTTFYSNETDQPLNFRLEFGRSVAIHDDLIVVGAPNYHPGPNSPYQQPKGIVYVFRKVAGSWQLETELPQSSDINAQSADAVAVSENLIIVSARYFNVECLEVAAYVYVYDGTRWIKQDILRTGGLTYIEPFHSKFSVAVSDSNVILGEATIYFQSAPCIGGAVVFEADVQGWQEKAVLTANGILKE